MKVKKHNSKHVIMNLADKYLNVCNIQCKPLLVMISSELKELYPMLSKMQRDDWALVFINTGWDYQNMFDSLDWMMYDTKSGQPG